MLNHALATSCLDYSNMLSMGLSLSSFQKPQLVQNAVAQTGFGVSHYVHVTWLQ